MTQQFIASETNCTEHHIGEWVTEASELGIPPGVVPSSLPTTLGNGQAFQLVHAGSDRFLYRQGEGCIGLVVFND